ncbi:DUF6919 domain-containing protein [Rhodococcus qingshengii]|uniref:DUF6919 domain-containing protein n=1 Tax=Rhodococcus qingshengii TaxID=334542 RepID=UPI003701BB99
MPIPWMSWSDRRRWRSARTVADLGELMAQWLERRISSRPGYTQRHGPDEETEHLVPTLAALCRAGYITTQSQPGLAGTGVDGRWWQQRAMVDLVVTDAVALARLLNAAGEAGMIVRVIDYGREGSPGPLVTVTTCAGHATAWTGRRIGPQDMALRWPGLTTGLYDQVAHGTYVSVVAPEYGHAGERLWPVLLDLARGLRRHDTHA